MQTSNFFLTLIILLPTACFSMQPDNNQLVPSSYTIKTNNEELKITARDLDHLVGLKALVKLNEVQGKNITKLIDFDADIVQETLRCAYSPHIYARLIAKDTLPEVFRIANYCCADLRVLKLLAKRIKAECNRKELDPLLYDRVCSLNKNLNSNLPQIKMEDSYSDGSEIINLDDLHLLSPEQQLKFKKIKVLNAQGLNIDTIDGIEDLLSPEQRSAMTVVNLSHNGFTDIPDLGKIFPNAKEIDLSDNCFTTVPSINVSKDAQINLARNFIRTLPLLPNYQANLDISSNSIFTKDIEGFTQRCKVANVCAQKGIEGCNKITTLFNKQGFKYAMSWVGWLYGETLYRKVLKQIPYTHYLDNGITLQILLTFRILSFFGAPAAQAIMNLKLVKLYDLYTWGVWDNIDKVTNPPCSGIAHTSQKVSTFLSTYSIPFKTAIINNGQYPTLEELKHLAACLKGHPPTLQIPQSTIKKGVVTQSQILKKGLEDHPG